MLNRSLLFAAALSAASLLSGQEASAQFRPVIQPLLYAPQEWFIPHHVGGDREFKGHGPEIWLNVSLYIKPQAPNEVWALVEMRALETKHDWTHAYDAKHVRVATFARPLTRIVTVDRLPCTVSDPFGRLWAFHYIDTNHDVDTFNNPCACGLLNTVRFIGDTRGDEAGTRTGVLLEFNPILAQ